MIITLTGGNSFLLQAELKKKVDEFLTVHGEIGLEKIDGEEAEYDRIREALESLPFLVSRKMVMLRNGSMIKQFVENLDKLSVNLPETTDLIIVETKLDKRSSYYKFLKKNTDYHEFNELEGFELTKWLVSSAKEQGAKLSSADAKYLIDRVGANQQLLSNELAKLINYDSSISRETIELLTDRTPQSTVFELLDAAFAGNIKRAMDLYDEQRQLKVEPQQIIAMLAWQLHILALVKTAAGREASAIASEAKVNPYVVRKSQAVANKLSLKDLKNLIQQTLDLDIRLKSTAIDADEALKHLILTMR